MTTEQKSQLSANGIRTFTARAFHPENAKPVTVGVGIQPMGQWTNFMLIRPDVKHPDTEGDDDDEEEKEGEEDRAKEDNDDDDAASVGGNDGDLWFHISSQMKAHRTNIPDSQNRYLFWMKTYSENRGLLEHMAEAGVARYTGRSVMQGFVEIQQVELLMPLSEMIKRCGFCEKWEHLADERMEVCSKCKAGYQVYYCNKKCRLDSWYDEDEPHKDVCGDIVPVYSL